MVVVKSCSNVTFIQIKCHRLLTLPWLPRSLAWVTEQRVRSDYFLCCRRPLIRWACCWCLTTQTVWHWSRFKNRLNLKWCVSCLMRNNHFVEYAVELLLFCQNKISIKIQHEAKTTFHLLILRHGYGETNSGVVWRLTSVFRKADIPLLRENGVRLSFLVTMLCNFHPVRR